MSVKVYVTEQTTVNGLLMVLFQPFNRHLLFCYFQAKYVMPPFNSKRKHEKLVGAGRVHQTTLNLVISRCCFGEDGKEMYKDL